MRKLLLFSLLVSSFNLFAIMDDGDIAPDFSITDIDGVTHDLYDYLDDGYSVVLDMSATWCGPCWTFHQNGIMDDIWADYGPGGDDMVITLLIEVDPATNQACFFGPTGCNNNTLGDWSAGIEFPLANPGSSQANSINNDYEITFFPTMYVISPNRQIKGFDTGSATSYDDLVTWAANTFQLWNSEVEIGGTGCGDGFIDLTPFQGEGDLEFEWSNGATTEDLYNLSEGEFYVTICDENICGNNDFEIVLGPYEIEGFEAMDLDDEEITNVDCYLNNSGSIYVEIEGGSGEFIYEWSNGDEGEFIENLYAGDYEVTVIDEYTDCELELEFEVEEPDEMEFEYETEPAGCDGSLGEIEFEIDGGVDPFTYLIDDEEYDDDVLDLPAGDYNVLVIDDNGCEIEGSFTIDQLESPISMANVTGAINCENSTTEINSDGSSSGTGISYYWYDANNMQIGDEDYVNVNSGGEYTLEVYDANSECSSFTTVSVESNTTVPTALSSASNDLNCNAPNATLSGQGSSTGSNISYKWTTTDGNITSTTTSIDITVDAAGTYTLEVTDNSNGCISNTSLTVAGAAAPDLTVSGATEFCEGSSTILCASLGMNETVEWMLNGVIVGTSECYTMSSTGSIVAILTNNMTGCSAEQMIDVSANQLPNSIVSGENGFCTGSSTEVCSPADPNHSYEWTLDGITISTENCVTINQSGTLMLVTTDNMTGCVNSSNIQLSELALPTGSIATPSMIDCNNASTILDLTVDGMNNSYAWFDQNGVLISMDQDPSVSQAGTYTVYVTNNAGCESTFNAIVEADTALPQFSVDAPEEINCTNTTSTINITLTDPSNVVSWYDANGNLISNNEDLTVEEGGTYVVIVSNDAGCATESSIIVEIDDTGLATSGFEVAGSDFNFSFSDSSVGEEYTVSWDFGDGNTSTEQNPNHEYTTPGYYNVCLTVSNTCGTNTSCQEILAASALSVEVNSSDIICNGDNNGSIQVSIAGGLEPYVIEWENGSASGTELENLEAGTYIVNISDETGAQESYTVEINEPEAISLEGSIVGTPMGAAEGEINLSIGGGTGNLSVIWNDGSTELNRTGLERGSYTVTVEDENGCSRSMTFVVQGSTSTNEFDGLQDYVISPNPSSDYITLNISLDNHRDLMVSFISMTGQRIESERVSGKEIVLRKDVGHLAAGVYLVELKAEKDVAIKKLIVR